MRYRVKLIINLEETTDAHFWYRDTLVEAKELKLELDNELAVCPHRIYIYADTSQGHIRVI